MRIGFFADEYLPRLDGVITSMTNAAAGLRQLGHEVFFVVPDYPNVPADDHVMRISSTPAPLSDNVRLMVPSKSVRQQITELKLDVIHSHTPFAAGMMARRAAKELDLPHVATFHTLLPVLLDYYPLRTRSYLPAIMAYVSDIVWSGSDDYIPPESAGRSAAKRWAWKLTGAYVDSVDYVISPSKHFANLIESLGVKTPVGHIPNSLELARYQPTTPQDTRPLTLTAVGRLSPEKRQAELVQAMSRVAPNLARLLLVGDGPDRAKLEKLVRELDLAEVVEFSGTVSPDEVVKILHNSQSGALVSYDFDNQPMTMLEYLATGLPVLYCDPNLSEVVGPEAGMLTGPDADSIAAGIKELAENFGLRQSLARAALKQSDRYAQTTIAQQLADVYEELAAA